MRKILSVLVSAAVFVVPMALFTAPVSAKTATQVKHEKKGAAAKEKSSAKSAVKKKK